MDKNETAEVAIKHSIHRKLEDFEQDEIGVKKVANVIEFIVKNLDARPFVIGLNSSWGTGKTEFIRMWCNQLKTNGWKYIEFNSWENDFYQDPLACLLGEMEKEFDPEAKSYLPSWKGVKEAAKYLVKKSVPGVIKHVTVGAVDLEGIGDAIGDAAKDATEKAIESHSDLKTALVDFRGKLAELAEKVVEETGHPLLIIVDELDRCRPTFALEMLEAIKHLFEVENVVFVLAYAGEQLACSTQAIYGANFDGKGYLQRFFNIELQLPQNPAKFLESEAGRMGLAGWINSTSNRNRVCGGGADFLTTLRALAVVHNFKLRTIQRILTRASVAISGIGTDNKIYSFLLAPLIALSVKDPKLVGDYFDRDAESNFLIDTLWPMDRMHRLFPAMGSDSALTWAYASSVFYFTHLDFVEKKIQVPKIPFEQFSKPVLESRSNCLGYDRLKSAFEFLEMDHGTHYWGHNTRNQLQGYLEGSLGLSAHQ